MRKIVVDQKIEIIRIENIKFNVWVNKIKGK